MKSLFFALGFLLFFASCQKEITSEVVNSASGGTPVTGGTTSTTGNMKAKINSVQWIADKAAQAGFSTAANGLPRLLNISGVSSDKKYFTITLADSGVHVYTLSDNGFAAAAFIDSTSSNPLAFTTNQGPAGVKTGTVSVTSINTTAKTVSGTFSFTIYRQMDGSQKTITEGAFTDLPYVDGSSVLPPASTTDTFTVKINDVLFKPFHISGTAQPVVNNFIVQASDSLVVKNVGVIFPVNTAPGTYTLDLFGAVYIGQYNTGATSLASTSGTLELLENNTVKKRLRGKFNFKAEQLGISVTSANLTEGYFSVQY